MLRRVLTAIILMPPVVYLIGWSPLWLFLLALLVTVETVLSEYFRLCRQAGFKAFPWVGYGAAGLLCLTRAVELHHPMPASMALLVVLLVGTLTLAVFHVADLKDYLGAAASTILGVLYVGFTLSLLVPMRFASPGLAQNLSSPSAHGPVPQGRVLMLFLFLVVWAGDVFAFLGGRAVGRTPFFPRVSPKKTVEGAITGFVGSLLVAWGFGYWFWQTPGTKRVMLLGGIVAVAGQVGDLVESALKRGANVKDSGTLLPGHGGLLDRMDSLLFSVPVLWLALTTLELWP
jgi:phosphatidate cytidylyltransferase